MTKANKKRLAYTIMFGDHIRDGVITWKLNYRAQSPRVYFQKKKAVKIARRFNRLYKTDIAYATIFGYV